MSTYSWLEIYENGSWDIVLIVGLVEEDILAVSSLLFGCILFQCAVFCNAMLAAEMLPKVRTDLITVGNKSRAASHNERKVRSKALLVRSSSAEALRLDVPALTGLEGDKFPRHDGSSLHEISDARRAVGTQIEAQSVHVATCRSILDAKIGDGGTMLG